MKFYRNSNIFSQENAIWKMAALFLGLSVLIDNLMRPVRKHILNHHAGGHARYFKGENITELTSFHSYKWIVYSLKTPPYSPVCHTQKGPSTVVIISSAGIILYKCIACEYCKTNRNSNSVLCPLYKPFGFHFNSVVLQARCIQS